MLDQSGGLDRRLKTTRDLISLTPPTPELLADEIDGELYAYKKEWRCRVCTLDDHYRNLVDTLLVYPKGYQEVLETITPLLIEAGVPENRRPSYMSIRNHQKRHLPWEKAAIVEMAQRRAAQAGRTVLSGKERLLTAEAVLELIVQRGWDRLTQDRLHPDVGETINAAMKLHQLEQAAAASTSMHELLMQLQIVLQAVRDNVPDSMWSDIAADIQRARENLGMTVVTTVEDPQPVAG